MRLIDADRLTYFFWLPSSGIDEVIDEYIAKYPKLKTEYLESCQALCRDMIQGLINVIDTEPTVYDKGELIWELERRADKAENDANAYFGKQNQQLYLLHAGRAEGIKEAVEIVRGGQE